MQRENDRNYNFILDVDDEYSLKIELPANITSQRSSHQWDLRAAEA